MKKTETVKVPAKPARAAKPATTKKVEKTVCDFCGASLPDHGSFGWYPNCCLCGRDTCRKHNISEPDELGDYPDFYCTICYDLKYVKYIGERDELDERYHQEKEAIDRAIKKESLDVQPLTSQKEMEE